MYKQAEGLEIKGIDPIEFYRFASKHFKNVSLSQDVFSLIYRLADGETKLIQQICNKLYTQVQLDSIHEIDEDKVRNVINSVLDAEDGIYRMIDGNLKPNQRKALRHLVRFNGEKLLSYEHLKATNISKSSLNTALTSLYDGIKGHGYMIDKDYDTYFIPDRCFELWIYRAVFNCLP